MSDILDDLPALTPRPRLFSLQGRLGRVRYVAYCMLAVVFAFLFCLICWAGLTLLFSRPMARTLYIVISVLLFYAVLPIFFAMQTVRRVHDFNMGGWLALLLLVPIIDPLLFWFAPGTRGDNAYGPPPEEESPLLKLVAVVLPILFIAGFLSTAKLPENSVQHPDPSHRAGSLQPYTP